MSTYLKKNHNTLTASGEVAFSQFFLGGFPLREVLKKQVDKVADMMVDMEVGKLVNKVADM